ncbi:MAG: type III PLP-dependent enzyme, partial [Gammaproteobacteria bacterium]
NRCNEIIQQAQTESGKLLSVLDIGGGFPADYSEQIDISRFCQPINEALQQLPDHIQVIAEPGRYISAAAMTSISRIVGKARRNDKTWYYIDDGVYGSFSGMIYDHAQYPLTVYSDIPELEEAVIAGPTCDSIDVIAKDILLPPLNIGDLIIGEQMGAYTSASATDFNLAKRAEFIVINRGDIAEKEHQTISA